jgi:membrane protease YdiL (CAAX protease family)
MHGVSKLPLKSIQSLNDVASVQLWSLLKGLTTPQLITLALTAGVGEELLFRGWLMQSITGNLSTCSAESLFAGIVGSSLLFGFAHPISRMYILLAFLMGCFFGVLYWWTGNLIAPIAAHWIYDAILMVAFVRTRHAEMNRR